MTKAIIIFAYALIVLVGGLIGHYKAASLPSLIMGTASALLLLWGGYGMYYQSERAENLTTTLVGFLTLFFLYRFNLTLKWMPAGMMMVMSSSVVIALLFLPSKKIA